MKQLTFDLGEIIFKTNIFLFTYSEVTLKEALANLEVGQ